MWYEWECLGSNDELVGYCMVEYDHEITTDTLEADAEKGLQVMKSNHWLQAAVKLGKVSKV